MALTILNIAYPFAQVAPDTAGGAEQVLASLDAAATAAGHRSIVVACAGSRVAGELVGVPAIGSLVDGDASRLGWMRHKAAILKALRRFPVDVVHMHGVDFLQYLPPPGPPTLVTLHLPVERYPAAAWQPGRPDTWLNAVSWTQHAQLRHLAAGQGGRLLAPVENGIDPAAFDLRCRRRGFALMLARICPEKGIHLGLDAARLAGIPLLIAGDVSPYPDHCRYFSREVRPRLGRRHRYLGRVGPRAKRRLLAAARCLLVPSQVAETSSLVAREAAAAGTPVIAFGNGALPETVEHGRTGFIVADVAAMAAAIAHSDTISPDICRRTAWRRFSAARMTSGYLRIYGELARHKMGFPATAS